MFRAIFGTAFIAGLGLFGYYFLTDSSGRSAADKAKDAGMNVVSDAKDSGAALLIQGRLMTAFGMDAMRLVHVYYDNGHVIVYGLAPESIDVDAVERTVREIPGAVSQVEILFLPRPATVQPRASSAGPTGQAGGDAPTEPQPDKP